VYVVDNVAVDKAAAGGNGAVFFLRCWMLVILMFDNVDVVDMVAAVDDNKAKVVADVGIFGGIGTMMDEDRKPDAKGAPMDCAGVSALSCCNTHFSV
jgi:hypothetical protein